MAYRDSSAVLWLQIIAVWSKFFLFIDLIFESAIAAWNQCDKWCALRSRALYLNSIILNPPIYVRTNHIAPVAFTEKVWLCWNKSCQSISFKPNYTWTSMIYTEIERYMERERKEEGNEERRKYKWKNFRWRCRNPPKVVARKEHYKNLLPNCCFSQVGSLLLEPQARVILARRKTTILSNRFNIVVLLRVEYFTYGILFSVLVLMR